MQVDQSKLLDQLAYKDTTDTTKGIANYIASGSSEAKKAGTGLFQSKLDSGMSISSAETIDMSGTTYMRPQTEQEKTAAEGFAEQSSSAQSRYNQMAVIANTTSGADLKELEENGYSLENTDSRTIVTVTDKIKAALAKAGVDVSEYGDALSEEQLEEITGSRMLANRITTQLHKQDLPASEENVEDMADAMEKMENLRPLSEDEIVYLIKNDMSPTLQNIYCAEYSAQPDIAPQASGTYTGIYQTAGAKAQAAYARAAGAPNSAIGMAASQHNAPVSGKIAIHSAGALITEDDFAQLKPQITQVVREAGLAVGDDTIEDGRFLLEKGVLLTPENLTYYEGLKDLSAQIADGEVGKDLLSSMCDAIEEGGRPMDAMLLAGYSLKDRAKISQVVIDEATDEDLAYVIAEDKELTVNNLKTAEENRDADTPTVQAARQIVSERGLQLITARRQLEEVRLAMTSEANYALLKRGISVDTKPLVELVDDLRSQEDQYYRSLLKSEGLYSERNVSIFKETDEIVEELKAAPAYVLKTGEADTLRSLHQEGAALKERFIKANETYEALMTSPREELGDNIKKAFTNVDAILKDLDMETSEANRRAVRILAYNSTELTRENITEIKMKDEEVQRAFANLTPKVTMEMIKKNINPLDMDMSELNQTAEEIRMELGEDDTELYQKYLWKLEQNNKITNEERKSYIGIYRLITQVEKADNAAIGSLVQQGAQITMRSLLTAVRVGQKTPVDYRIGDRVSGVNKDKKNVKIDDQIMASYQKNCLRDAKEKMTPKAAEKLKAADYEKLTPEQVKEIVEEAAAEGKEVDKRLEQKYIRQEMQDFSEVLATADEIYEYLDRCALPNTMNNLLAVRGMLKNRNEMFETLWNADGGSDSSMEQIEAMKAQVLERFGEAVKSPEAMADAQETLADVAEHVMDTMIIENDATGTLDLKALRLMNTQFSICAKQAKEESYMIPIQTSDGVAGVSLKIVRGTKKKGMVDILFRSDSVGKIAASIEAKDRGFSGMIVTDSPETKSMLSGNLTQLALALRGPQKEKVDIRVALADNVEMGRYENRLIERQTLPAESEPAEEQTAGETGSAEAYNVQTSRLYHIAENFIKTLQKFV